jgi:hypothetical protein
VKNLLRLSLLASCAICFNACAFDTHYDSVSTHVDVNVVDAIKGNNEVKIFHRFQFDRDLTTVSNMSLYEAWLEIPEINQKDAYDAEGVPFEMSMFRAFDVSVVISDDAPSEPWLALSPDMTYKKNAMFKANDKGDLRDYMDDDQQFELEFDIKLEPYHLTRYWRDVCHLSDECVMSIPLSMQFKMKD